MWSTAKQFIKTKKFCISKNYKSYANFDNIDEIINIINDPKNNYNELICKDSNVKPYFDIESSEQFDIFNIVLTIKNVFYDLTSKRLLDNQIFVLSCNRTVNDIFKWSYHVIIDNYHFDNQQGAKDFAKYINEIHSQVDLSVYSNGYQNIRMLNCVKKGETVPFTLFNKEYSDEIFSKCLITNISEDSIALEFEQTKPTYKHINFEESELSDIIPLIEKDLECDIINLKENSDYYSFNYDHKFKCLFGEDHSQLGHFIKKNKDNNFDVFCFSKKCKGRKNTYKNVFKALTTNTLIPHKKINNIVGFPTDSTWEIDLINNGMKAVSNCENCLINPCKLHSQKNHSSLFLNKDKTVVKSCFTCGTEVVDKTNAKKLMTYFNVIVDTKENTIYQELVKELTTITFENNYKREKNTGVVYKQIKPYAYERHLNAMDFLNEIFYGDKDFISNVNNMDNLIKFMKQYDDPDFPFLKYNDDYLGFNNGVLNKITCKFTKLPPDDIIVKKYFDYKFEHSLNTPNLDKVLDYQFDNDTRDFIYACLGRMFGVNDNFGFMLYLLGFNCSTISYYFLIISNKL